MTNILAITVNDVGGRGMTVSTNFIYIVFFIMCLDTTVVTLSMTETQ